MSLLKILGEDLVSVSTELKKKHHGAENCLPTSHDQIGQQQSALVTQLVTLVSAQTPNSMSLINN